MRKASLPKASEVNPFDEDARHEWIVAYLKAKGPYIEDKINEKYQASVDAITRKIHNSNVTQVGRLFFEYYVGEAIWMKTFQNRKRINQTPDWPWTEKPQACDMSQGISLKYRQWRLDEGLLIML
ncbi:hypothetical protein IL306_009971 [Fusarium sp. DS 682]|nr:hypothetical protein IL306_009971 [Fusarium sp. DS 682]